MTFHDLLNMLKDIEKYKPHLLTHEVELAVDLDYTVQLDLAEAMGRERLIFMAMYVESE